MRYSAISKLDSKGHEKTLDLAGDCEAVLNGLASSPACANLQANTQAVAPKAAGAGCQTVKELEKTYTFIPPECCPALRTLVTNVSGQDGLLYCRTPFMFGLP